MIQADTRAIGEALQRGLVFQWVVPQAHLSRGSDPMRERWYEAFGPTNGQPSTADYTVAVDITYQVRHNPVVVAEV